jgi:hypothetical protein
MQKQKDLSSLMSAVTAQAVMRPIIYFRALSYFFLLMLVLSLLTQSRVQAQEVPPLFLEAPADAEAFTACTVADTYQPTFSWTAGEPFAKYIVAFSLSPTNFSSPIVRTVISGSNSSWTPSVSIWKSILKASQNGKQIRPVYWRVSGKRADGTRVQTETRSLTVTPPERVQINSPATGEMFQRNPLPLFSFNTSCNVSFSIEVSPYVNFFDPGKVQGFPVSTGDPNIPTIEKALSLEEWKTLKTVVLAKGYFRIKAWDRLGRNTISEVRSFQKTFNPPSDNYDWCWTASNREGAAWLNGGCVWDNPDMVTNCGSINLDGLAFVSIPCGRCIGCSSCTGNAVADTGVTVSWKNLATGQAGNTEQDAWYDDWWGIPVDPKVQDWWATVPLAIGQNSIVVSAADVHGGTAWIQFNVTRPVPGYSVKGSVSTSGFLKPQDLFNFSLSLNGSSETMTTVPKGDGTYAFRCLPNGEYTLTPVASVPYPFTPETRTATLHNANVTGQDFVAEAFLVSGRIAWPGGHCCTSRGTIKISGTNFTAEYPGIGWAGTYSFALPNGTYTITPSGDWPYGYPGPYLYTFLPSSLTVTVNGADVVLPDFVAK